MFIAIAITSSVINTGLLAKCAVYALGCIANQVGHFFHRLGDVLHKTQPASRLMIKGDEKLVPSETQPGLPSSYELIQDLSTADFGNSSSNVTSNPSNVIEKKQVDILKKNISITRICFMNFVDLYRARIVSVMHSALHTVIIDTKVAVERFLGLESGTALKKSITPLRFIQMNIMERFFATIIVTAKDASCPLEICKLLRLLIPLTKFLSMQPRFCVLQDSSSVDANISMMQYLATMAACVKGIASFLKYKSMRCFRHSFRFWCLEVSVLLVLLVLCIVNGWNAPLTIRVDGKLGMSLLEHPIHSRHYARSEAIFDLKVTPLNPIARPIEHMLPLPDVSSDSLLTDATAREALESNENPTDLDSGLVHEAFWKENDVNTASISQSNDWYFETVADSPLVLSVDFPHWVQYMNDPPRAAFDTSLVTICEVNQVHSKILSSQGFAWKKCIAALTIRVDGKLGMSLLEHPIHSRHYARLETTFDLKVTPLNPIARPIEHMLPLPDVSSNSLMTDATAREALESNENPTDLDSGLVHEAFWKENDVNTASISQSNDWYFETVADSPLVLSVDFPHWVQYMNDPPRAAFDTSLVTICEVNQVHSKILSSQGFAWKKCIAALTIRVDGKLGMSLLEHPIHSRHYARLETTFDLKVTPLNPIARPIEHMLPLPDVSSDSLLTDATAREALESNENPTDLDSGLVHDALVVASISQSNDWYFETVADSPLVLSVDFPHWIQYRNDPPRAVFDTSLVTFCEVNQVHSKILSSQGFAWKKCIATAALRVFHGYRVSAVKFVKVGEGGFSANQYTLRIYEETAGFLQQRKLLDKLLDRSTTNKSLNWSPLVRHVDSFTLLHRFRTAFLVAKATGLFDWELRHLALVLLALVYHANTNEPNPTSASNFEGEAAFVGEANKADETPLPITNSKKLRRESKGLCSDLGMYWRTPPKRRCQRSVRERRQPARDQHVRRVNETGLVTTNLGDFW